MTTENNLSGNTEKELENIQNANLQQNQEEQKDFYPFSEEQEDLSSVTENMSLKEALSKMEEIVNQSDAGKFSKLFNQLREHALHLISDEIEDKKHQFVEEGKAVEDFKWEHPQQSKLSALTNIYKEKLNDFHKAQEKEQQANLEERKNIIERLKSLYTDSQPGVNLFKEIRNIKEAWSNAGQVAKVDFKLVNNDYFYHLNQFYQMLDLNKEYLEQEYAHNLEKRKQIIQRAKELTNEPVVQKALNELQFLHRLWKEEAEPVAEEFREKTWEEFKEISNKIHERKSELTAAIEKEQNANLEIKNKIIEAIRELTNNTNPNHTFWQEAMAKVEELRSQFLKTGSVPRKLSNQNWNDFKTTLRAFNSAKNGFYKNLKGAQQANLEEKLKLIQLAKDNMNSEDWETAVPLFKKLQEDWKNIGHVPRSMTNKVWDEFRNACNTFFNNYREKNNAVLDNWKENFKQKKELVEQLKTIGNEEGSIEQIEAIKNKWNSIGKVPRDKMSINAEFNKLLREKLKLNKINEFELKEEGLNETQLTDKARKIKNQISELENEIVTLENNLGFFTNPSRENPLLKDTYEKIDEKHALLESLKQSLHSIIHHD